MSGRRINLRVSPATAIVAGALVALAAWPVYLGARASASGPPVAVLTPAPVKPDWKVRDANIAFLESRAGKVRGDMLTPRMLSGEYLQRYRERGDLGDVLRSEHAARLSLAAMPHRNVAGDAALAGALLTLHRFRDAKAAILDARRTEPDNAGLAAEEAALDLELGDVEGARRLVGARGNDPAYDVVAARLDEETGRLADARTLVDGAMRRADAIYDTPAERRAWFHARAAELAFAAGDHDAARRAAQDSLAIFPGHLRALTMLARVELADGRTAEAEDAAKRAAAIQPNPEVLGMLADAQAALGEHAAAAATRDEIFAVERIGDAQHVNDRLIAVYEADHRVRVADAYAIAKRELAVRDDVYAEDTLALAAARSGHWDVARTAIARAQRYGIEDSRIRAHAAEIAAHVSG
ncbi:MAG: tetratricopeptide repeat protein [Candidatus Eremiobacteraeota bacterium]|nr:tetratricopeptide repeat protein [Candidatus Eremiobacteraeota bacterium]